MAMGNLALLVFLGLKNTPLSLFALWSYERLNIVHQVAGYTTIAFVIIHLSCYSSYFVGDGRPERLLGLNEIFGMVAATAFVVLGFTGAVIRRWWYELFYYLHVGLWTLGIVMTGLHQPEMGKYIIIITLVTAGMWLVDRLIRASRLMFYSVNNTAILTPLPNGGTRVRLAKPPAGAETGKHCFLWIPAIRAFESHPFTIASIDPLEFVVASYDGFTSDLHKYAVEHPETCMKASVEGPYGAFPDASSYDKVVLVSGGGGASFTFGIALSLIKQLPNNTGPQIDFIWVTKKKCELYLRI
jgi:predicted ferric reductase